MQNENCKRKEKDEDIGVGNVCSPLGFYGGGGLLTGCDNISEGGSGSSGGGRTSNGGSGTPPLVAPSTADMVKDMENVIPNLKGTADETKVKDFLDALSSSPAAKDAFDKWAKTDPNNPNSGYDKSKADAIKALADKYATEKNTAGTSTTIVDTIKDLANNNDGSDANKKGSDLKDILDKTNGNSIANTIENALNTADTERQAVLKALSGTSPNAATSAGEAKSTALNSLGVTSADLYPIIKDLSDTNKNKLASLDNDLIKTLVKDKAGKNPTGSNALKDYLNGSSDIADLTTYKDAIKANYPESNGQTLAQFIQNQKDLKNIYNKLGGGNEAAGKVAYDALVSAGLDKTKISTLVNTLGDINAAKIKGIDASLVKQLVVDKANKIPNGTDALKDYLTAGGDTADLNTYKDGIINSYPQKNNQTLTEFIQTLKDYGKDGATGNRAPLTGTAATGNTVTDAGKMIEKGKQLTNEDGKLLGHIYKVDATNRIVYVVGIPTDHAQTSSTTSDISWSKAASARAYTDEIPTANAASGYSAWTAIHQWNPTALYENYKAIETALCYPKKPADVYSAYGAGSDSNKKNEAINAVVNGTSLENRWYLPSVDELKDIYNSLADLPNGADLKGKTFWSVNVAATGETLEVHNNDTDYKHYAKSVTFENNGATVKNMWKATTSNMYIVPVGQFKY